MYVKNADLTRHDIDTRIQKCGYEDITATCSATCLQECIIIVRTPDDEIIGFTSLPSARRVLTQDYRYQHGK